MQRTLDFLSALGLPRKPLLRRSGHATVRSAIRPAAAPVAYEAPRAVEAALAAIGRTEDIQFSPDDSRLAICGFLENRLLVLDMAPRTSGERPVLRFPRHLDILCPAFAQPHGVTWVDRDILAVANRAGDVVVLRLPPAGAPGPARVTLDPLVTIRAGAEDGLEAPGSIAAIDLGGGYCELLVCNNQGHSVTSHILDAARGFAVDSGAPLVAHGLRIPDSIALAPRARWIAVSNHRDHSVFLHENGPELTPDSPPAGILRGVLYPHGLRFSADGRRLFVADAGLPLVQVYASEDGDWRGPRYPVQSLETIDDPTYMRGRTNPEEGGPKGLDLTADDAILVTTCDEAPFLCFDVRGMGAGAEPGGQSLRTSPPRAAYSPGQAIERHRRIAARRVA